MAEEPMAIDEYLRTPEVLLPQELVYGYVREAAAPTAVHQRTVGVFISSSTSALTGARTPY
jgi:hypothetical protein